jgi:anti-sigma regulatory factor (Ser/Thr protein kinase)
MQAHLRHNAMVYESEDEYVRRASAFLHEGLDGGEGAVVAHTPRGLALMREALGADGEQVRFVDVSRSYTRPAKTLGFFHHVLSERLHDCGSVRVVVDGRLDPGDWNLWLGYEAIFNRCFAHLPAWVVCTYDANEIPDEVIEGVWRTHSEVVSDNAWGPSHLYSDPDTFMRRMTPSAEPLPGLRPLDVGGDDEELCARLAGELAAEQVPEAQMFSMLLAATEVTRNAIDHGGGVTAARVGRAEGRFVCEIVDAGAGFDDPAAGYVAPRNGIGTGLWNARRLTWHLEFFHSPAGFTARIWI